MVVRVIDPADGGTSPSSGLPLMLLPAIIELADAPHTIVENVFEYIRLNLGGLTAPFVVVVVATTVCCFCESDSEGTVIVMLILPVAAHPRVYYVIIINYAANSLG